MLLGRNIVKHFAPYYWTTLFIRVPNLLFEVYHSSAHFRFRETLCSYRRHAFYLFSPSHKSLLAAFCNFILLIHPVSFNCFIAVTHDTLTFFLLKSKTVCDRRSATGIIYRTLLNPQICTLQRYKTKKIWETEQVIEFVIDSSMVGFGLR